MKHLFTSFLEIFEHDIKEKCIKLVLLVLRLIHFVENNNPSVNSIPMCI